MTALIVTRHARIPRFCGCGDVAHYDGPCADCPCPACCKWCRNWGFLTRRELDDEGEMQKVHDDCPEGCA